MYVIVKLLLVALTPGPPVRAALQPAEPVAPVAVEHVIDAFDTKTISPLALVLKRGANVVCASAEQLTMVNKTRLKRRMVAYIVVSLQYVKIVSLNLLFVF
jgi:hypothetical protein